MPDHPAPAHPGVTLEEERAYTILESITEAFFSLDRSFCFSYLNGTAVRLLGRTDLVGKNVWEEFPAAQERGFGQAYARAMTGERVDFVEYYPAPLERWYEVRAYPSRDGVSVYFQDITDRRLAEEQYRRSREQLELVMRGAAVGVWYCPLPFDRLIWDDRVKEHFFLAPDAEVTIETFYERLHPDDREPTRAAIARSVEERSHYDIEYRTCSPDGRSNKWIHAVGRAFYDEGGQPTRFDGVTLDISSRKAAELAMRASEERFRLATRATNDVVWDWDLVTNQVRWNESLQRAFGHVGSAAEQGVDFWFRNIHPDDRARVETAIRAAVADPAREHWEDEYRYRCANETYADVLDRGYVLRDASGAGVRMIGAMQDLTARKRIERERERMIEAERAARSEAERQSRMKDEFLAMLSHELRTPLNAILGWAHILASRTDPADERARAVEIIARNGRAQARIVDDLLEMSRLLSGKLRLEVSPVELVTIVEGSLDATRPAAAAKDIALEVDTADARGALVLGDAARLQQVIWNLLTNAIKFTPRGGHVAVRVRLAGSDIELSVEDDGEGIPADFLPSVFDRFRQADGSITRRHGGLGLGLSLVKQLVELHGGSVQAESGGAGLGSRFSLRLPHAREAGSGERSSATSAPGLDATSPDLTGVRVLIVDDEADARQLLVRLLQDRAALPVEAATTRAALDLLGSEHFDVLVSDIGMPEEDGHALVRHLRAGNGSNAGIPAIALTAYSRAEDRVHAIAAGFTYHVPKPVDPREIVAVVAAATSRLPLR